MSYRDWYVGMEVVCVQGSIGRGYGDEKRPEVGQTYTIRQLSIDTFTGIMCIRLAEIVNPVRIYTHIITQEDFEIEPAFSCRLFRALDERKTDISVFTAMLHTNKEPERA